MGVLTIRGVEGELDRVLRAEAARRGVSLNALVLDLVSRGLGVRDAGPQRHHDLDDLAGTWTRAEVAEFEAATGEFERVDADLWR